MRRFTTSAGTDRPLLGILLLVEFIVAVALLAHPAVTAATEAPPATSSAPSSNAPPSSSRTLTLHDGRTATLIPLGGGGSDIAAATTAQKIVFAPGAAEMSDGALRIVLRHELFHYASRAETATDAPRWLTEGVADFVGRPPQARPGPELAAELARVPTDADLDTAGTTRALAYDRAWWFSRFVADRYGTPTLRRLYVTACGPGHPDVATAVRDVLGTDLTGLMSDWRRWLSG
jgi:hypothetical protein